ncbi:MAG TPA: FtsX-like permease family protein, partial [Capillimicrobium sp.]
MRLTNLLHLYRIRLRHRIVQEALATLGIAAGVALVFASLVANTSLQGSVEQLNRGVVGDLPLQIAARGPGGLDAGLLAQVRREPSIRRAASVLEARAVVRGPEGERAVVMFAGDRALARWGGRLLRPFASPDLAGRRALAMPAPIAAAVGAGFDAPLEIVTAAGAAQTAAGAQLHESDIGDLVHSPVVIAPLGYAQRLSGLGGRVTRVFAEPATGREDDARRALAALAGDRADVLPGDAEVAVFAQAALPTRQSTGLFSLLAAVVGFLFATSAVLLTVPQRRRFIADLRYAGHAPSTVVQVIVTDGLVLGVVASAVGLALGDQLSRHLFDDVPGYLSFAWPLGDQRVVTWPTVAVAVAAGVASGLVAVLAPLRDILTRDLAPARGARRSRPRDAAAVGAGAACLAGSAAVLALAPAAAIAGIVLLTAAMLLLLPTLLAVAVGGLAWVGQWVRSPAPAIAVMELRSRAARTRTFALAATGAVAVLGSVAIGGAHRDLLDGLNASASDIDRNAELWATFPGEPNAFATTPFAISPRALRAVGDVDGVRDVRRYRGAFLDMGDRRVWVLGPAAGDP